MRIDEVTLSGLALALSAERKRQKLSREDAAAVCGVSTSFIRDAESSPGNCSLGKLAKLVNGLGLSLEISGHLPEETGLPKSGQGLGIAALRSKDQSRGIKAAAAGLGQTDFGVPDSQLVESATGGLPGLLQTSSHPGTGQGLDDLIGPRGSRNKSQGETS